MKNFILIISLSFTCAVQVNAQEKQTPSSEAASLPPGTIMIARTLYKGELLPTINHSEVVITAKRTFKSEADRRSYWKLNRDVRKAYPYAVLAGIKLREYDAKLATLPESEKASYMKQLEKELKIQFGNDLRNLTINQGRILIRLVNRETKMTGYQLVKDYRGGFSAFMWQSFAVLFGNSLKTTYDPSQGEDKIIEQIIRKIQDGDV